MTAVVATIGHNAPPSDAAILREQLSTTHAELGKRADELLAGVARVPAAIEDEAMEKRAIEFAKQIGAHEKLCDGTRKTVKAPYQEAVKVVDAFFGNMVDPLKTGRDSVLRKLTAFQAAKAEKERREREEAARIAAEEAAKAAAQITTDADLETAIAKEEKATEAAAATQSSTADLSRSRGQFGSVASLRTTLKHRVKDADAVPRAYLMVNEDAIKAAMKAAPKDQAGLPTIAIPGVEFYLDRQTVVR